MEKLVIRKATIADVDAVQNLNNGLLNYEMEHGFDSYVKDWALSEASKNYFLDLIKNQFVVVAEVDDKIIGYIAGSVYEDLSYSYYEGITAEVNNMFILEEFRRYGIGSKLMNSFFTWCNSKNAKRVMVTASSKNEKAINFYRQLGYNDINLTLKKDL